MCFRTLLSIMRHSISLEFLSLCSSCRINSLSVLPASFRSQDALKILAHSQSLQSAIKSGKTFIFGDSCVFSDAFVKDLYERLEKELEIFNASGSSSMNLSDDVSSASDTKMTHDSSASLELNQTPSESTGKHIVEKGSKKKKGIEDPLTALKPLANYLRPLLLNSMKEKWKAILMENANKMKQILDDMQRKVDEAFLNLQLYEKALELFDEDQSASVVLHWHLLGALAASIADSLFINLEIYNKLKSGLQVDNSQNSELVYLSPGERIGLVKTFPGSLSKKAIAVAESLEGKRLETFMVALRDLAEDRLAIIKFCTFYSSPYDLISQVSAETDPISLLAKVVSLLYVQASI
ncbi:hypothetical protein SAY86_008201 [Trapa natans]|uniref:E3 UFM1-protein ligase 1-like domain-containing protein n=1 Tax=Trapa natans TaxID=22666 RepID=A0AAN7K5Y6_TRANT|nr:hypothetical protein SAY86_008201 [Trapa natans]